MAVNTNLEIADETISISEGAFENLAQLTKVILPASLTAIEEFALVQDGGRSLSLVVSVLTEGERLLVSVLGYTVLELSIPEDATCEGSKQHWSS